MLMLLGIVGRHTPQARQRMAKAAALLGSCDEAVGMLAEEGLCLSVNQLRDVTAGMGRMLQRLTHQGSLTVAGNVSGRRTVVSLDGGHVRLREPRRGKTKKGRKRFTPAWREPRLFVIHAVDDDGRMADDFPPVIDGTLGSCDQFVALLLAYLRGLNLTEAARVQFVADGRRLDLATRSRTGEVAGTEGRSGSAVDRLWHAMEYLGKVAESKSLTGARKKQ